MSQPHLDVVVVGAGFAGMYAIHKLLKDGFTVRCFEAGDGVGGTWYWNRYPGARCDVQSMEYSYSFDDDLQQEWQWSEKYATQPEILTYANHVADRFNLREHITFETRVLSAHYVESDDVWQVTTEGGETLTARYCIMATGCLSSTNLPKFEGMDKFRGETYHTGQWPHGGVDFAGKTVGIIGTGSSSIQSIPVIAEACKDLTVFQRTANFSIPAHNAPITEEYRQGIKNRYAEFRAENREQFAAFGAGRTRFEDSVFEADDALRKERFEQQWGIGGLGFLAAFGDLGADRAANEIAAEFVRDKIRDIVDDAETAELLCPHQVIGCKRVCVDTDYYRTFNRDNVHLVDVSKNPVERLTERGLITGGKEYEFDIIIFATGFDAMTGTLMKIDIQGRDGLPLREKWDAGPRTYLGLATRGFPNLFTVSGPGSPSVLSNMIITIEQHVEWIVDCLNHLRDNNQQMIEPEQEAEDYWVNLGNGIADMTLFPTCNSWYLGANVPGKPRIFMPFVGGFPAYREICSDVANDNYRGFEVA